MGIYLQDTKEKPLQAWLDKNTTKLKGFPIWEYKSEGYLFLVEIEMSHNAHVVGIGYSEEEYNILVEPDGRTKTVYETTIDSVAHVPKMKYLLYKDGVN